MSNNTKEAYQKDSTAKPKGLFCTTTFSNEVSKDLLLSLSPKLAYVSTEFAEKCYDKYRTKLPIYYRQLVTMSRDELVEVLHASAIYLRENSSKFLNNASEVNTDDLARFVSTNINSAAVGDNLIRNGNGLSFLNSFVKEALLNVTVAGKGSKTLYDLVQDTRYLYKVAYKCMSFKADITLSRLFSTMRVVDTQTVSNIRPLAFAWLYNQYGIIQNPNPKKKQIWLRDPSQGWLGRLLSSYYVAYHNPDKEIHYVSTDPNLKVVEAFAEVTDFLKSFGGMHKVKNWFPEIHNHGAEVPNACFSDTWDYKFDVSATFPPYFGTEKYSETYIFHLVNGEQFKASEIDTLDTDDGLKAVPNVS